jgi:hypothetical protein
VLRAWDDLLLKLGFYFPLTLPKRMLFSSARYPLSSISRPHYCIYFVDIHFIFYRHIMETDERIELEQEARGVLWEDRVNASFKSGRLCTWVSSFHHLHLPCQLASQEPYYGSYNTGLKFTFQDGTAWLVRFPRVGYVHDSCMDEKVAMEVAVINLIREKSTIPVPKIFAWGIGAENTLELGPFIIMEFIQNGVSLNVLLKDANNGTRLLRDDLSDKEMETIYRQFANFMVQLFKLDFDYIGNLETPRVDLKFPSRPLTWKAHDILQTGGVDTFGTSIYRSVCSPANKVTIREQQQ